jgi:hypothetical protein
MPWWSPPLCSRKATALTDTVGPTRPVDQSKPRTITRPDLILRLPASGRFRSAVATSMALDSVMSVMTLFFCFGSLTSWNELHRPAKCWPEPGAKLGKPLARSCAGKGLPPAFPLHFQGRKY